jgi:hypothetical protein
MEHFLSKFELGGFAIVVAISIFEQISVNSNLTQESFK